MASAASAIVDLPCAEASSIAVQPLLLPPESEFDSYEAVYAFAQAHAKSALYAFVVGKADRRKGRVLRYLNCQRGGCAQTAEYRPGVENQHRKRKRNTAKTGCLFSIKVRERTDGTWDLCYREDAKYNTYNHSPAEASSAFAAHRQLSASQLEVVQSNRKARIEPARTVIAFQLQNPLLRIIPRDIYNINAQIDREKGKGKPPAEAFVAELERQKAAKEVVFEVKQDSQGHITFLFIALVKSVEYLNQNAEVVLLDCTYKTNKFDMPLLYIMGVDGLNQSFTIAICFLDQETEENYNKAVLQLRQLFNPLVYPSVLATDCEVALISALERHFLAIRTKVVFCFWHILKNVTLHCKPKFETMDRWELFLKGFCKVVQAKTEEEFEDILAEWKADFHWNDGHPHQASELSATSVQIQEQAEFELERLALVYCIGQWLTIHKSKVVHAWIDRFFHAGARTTSRLEGGHRTLKKWIGSSNGDLARVWEAAQSAIIVESNRIEQARARELQSIPILLSSQFFHGVVGKITRFGLYKLKEQYDYYRRYEELADDSSTICTGNFFSSFGVPCWHMIKVKITNNEAIQPLDFHPFYHYYRPSPGAEPLIFEPPILDPISRQQRRTEEAERRAHARQHNRLRTAQTGRILSQYEQAILPLRHCSACIPYGHDRTTCRGCRSTGHTRSNCPIRPPDQPQILYIPPYQPPAFDSFSNHTQIEGRLLQADEWVPATQYAAEFQSQLTRFY